MKGFGPFQATFPLLGIVPCSSQGGKTARNSTSGGEPPRQGIGNRKPPGDEAGAGGRDRRQKTGPTGKQRRGVHPSKENLKRPAVSAIFRDPEKGAGRPFVVKGEPDRNCSPKERLRGPGPHRMSVANGTEVPDTGRFPAGQAKAGKETGKEGDPSQGFSGQVEWGPVKYS